MVAGLYICILLMTMMGAVASLFLKRASGFSEIREFIFCKELYIGGILYVISALINIWVLKYLDYSVVLPMTAFTYVWTMILSRVILNESISKKKIFGVVMILIGAIFVSFVG